MKKLISLVLFILFTCNCITAELKTGNIIVSIKHLRNNTGEVRVALYNTSQGFPDKPQFAYRILHTNIVGQEAKVIFKDIPYGIYAVGILHDEDANGKMETNLIGIPKEGYGTSNNKKGQFGPPKFQECSFQFEEDELTIEITIFY